MSKRTINISTLTITLFMMFAITSQATAGGILYVDDDAPAAGDGTSWDTAYRFLQDALSDASGGGISEIHVAQGIYKPVFDKSYPKGNSNRARTFHLLNGVALMGGYAGIGAKDPDAREIELFETILSGDLDGNDEPDFVNYEDNSRHVTTGSDVDATALLEGFTITAGNADYEFIYIRRGGGFYAELTDATINLCKFEKNLARFSGGGLYHEDGSLSLTNCTFVGNKAKMGGGAHLRFYDFASPIIDNCTFTGNIATQHSGGGLAFHAPFVTAMITNCIFDSNTSIGELNTAISSGGMVIYGSTDKLRVVNCTFVNNSAFNSTGYGVGGGMSLVSADCIVVNCDFVGNSSSGKVGGIGGAVRVQSGNPQLINCLISGNSSTLGGGIGNLWGTATFVDCTITGNSATIMGGAVHSYGKGAEPLLTNCIMWDNGPEPIVDEENSVTTVNYSNVQGGWTGAGSNNIDADPMFVNPGSGDYRLSSGSPCIDAGHNWGVPLDELDYDEDGLYCELFPVDLDGNPRFNADEADFDPGCGIPVVVDLGAYEYQFDPVDEVIFCDLNGDRAVSIDDLELLLLDWGSCDGECCLADLDLNGTVNTVDLLILFANWGPCE